MNIAEFPAHAAGTRETSLIVADDDAGAPTDPGANRPYARLGYEPIARRPVTPFPGYHQAGDWVLMRKSLRARGSDDPGS